MAFSPYLKGLTVDFLLSPCGSPHSLSPACSPKSVAAFPLPPMIPVFQPSEIQLLCPLFTGYSLRIPRPEVSDLEMEIADYLTARDLLNMGAVCEWYVVRSLMSVYVCVCMHAYMYVMFSIQYGGG